jgi:hypothetical protein
MQLLFSARDVVGRVRWHAGTSPARSHRPDRERSVRARLIGVPGIRGAKGAWFEPSVPRAAVNPQ